MGYLLYFDQGLLNVECTLLNEEGPLDFPQHAVTSKELRDASVAAAKKLNAFNVRMTLKYIIKKYLYTEI